MADFDLKSPHVSCLYYLYKMKSLTAKELSDISVEDKAAISRSIDYLEKNGYLTCTVSTHKRYRAPIVLTEKGELIAMKLADKIDSILQRAGDGVSEENRRIMYEALTRISQNLDDICDSMAEKDD